MKKEYLLLVFAVLVLGLSYIAYNYSAILSIILLCGGAFLFGKTGYQLIRKK